MCFRKNIQLADAKNIIIESYLSLHEKFNVSKKKKNEIRDIIGYTTRVVQNEINYFFRIKNSNLQLTNSFEFFEIVNGTDNRLTKEERNLFLQKVK